MWLNCCWRCICQNLSRQAFWQTQFHVLCSGSESPLLNHRYDDDRDHQGTRVGRTIDDNPLPSPPATRRAGNWDRVELGVQSGNLLDTGRSNEERHLVLNGRRKVALNLLKGLIQSVIQIHDNLYAYDVYFFLRLFDPFTPTPPSSSWNLNEIMGTMD